MITLLFVFKWVLYSSAMASILAIIIIALKHLIKNRLGVRWHYYVWFLVLIRLLVPYAPQSSFSAFNLLNIPNITSNYSINSVISGLNDDLPPLSLQDKDVIVENIATTNNTPLDTMTNTAHISINYLMLASFVWLIGLIVLGFYTLIVVFQFGRKLARFEGCKDECIMKIVDCCKRKIGLKGNIIVLHTDFVKTPAVFGFLKPKLLIPIGINNQLETNELQYIIFHELGHLKRKDLIVNFVVAVLQILHWFNPILWYSFYCMRQDGELACDSLALSYIEPSEYKKYGQTLIRLLENCSKNNRVCGMSGIIEDKKQMKRRITMISKFNKDTYKWSVISIVILVVLSLILLTNAQGFKQKDIKNFSESIDLQTKVIAKSTEALSKASNSKNLHMDDFKEKLVVIDPGHGGNDIGAVFSSGSTDSNNNSLKEKDLNLKISLILFDLLKKSGIRAELTRKEDISLGLVDRAKFANGLGASLFLSIHNNQSQDSAENGTLTVFNPSIDYSTSYGITGERIAQLLQREIVSGLGTADGGLQRMNNLVVLKNTKMPSVIAEVAYITNDLDRQNLMTEEYRVKAAQTLHDAIVKILKEMASKKQEIQLDNEK